MRLTNAIATEIHCLPTVISEVHELAAEKASTWKIEVFFDPPFDDGLGGIDFINNLNGYFLDDQVMPYFEFHGIDLINEVNPHDVCASFGYGDPADGLGGFLFSQTVHNEHFHHRSESNWRTDPRLIEIWCTGDHVESDDEMHEPVKGGHGKGRNK